ncbi:MAG: hypothetical protein P4L45_12650, partial [Ignavibacteriaceae bacterium]|nr:hypothetical protein [Ignavibacteriaceae bacterium]
MLKKILYTLVTFLHLPADAVKMFMLANEISGINKKTLPTELLPLNTIQLSRGLLNFTVIQSRLNWVFPYWAEKQYNYQSLSFIPRSHLGLSMNVTQRNWTAVGNPDYNNEPIVDPRGLVTPFKDGWSIDVWLKVNDEIIFPSKSNDTVQALINDLPIVETKTTFLNNSLTVRVYTYKDNLYINAEAGNEKDTSIIFSIRPFNPEGISIINNIEFDDSTNSFTINRRDRIVFNAKPDFIYCSTFEESDSARSLTKTDSKFISACEYGMASAIAVFKCSDKTKSVQCSYNPSLNKSQPEYHSYSESVKLWEE